LPKRADARATLIASNLLLRQVKIVPANSGTPNSCAILYSICTISMHFANSKAFQGRPPVARGRVATFLLFGKDAGTTLGRVGPGDLDL
jgi:hypothetical protein